MKMLNIKEKIELSTSLQLPLVCKIHISPKKYK